MRSYAELHCVSNFTFLRGASHPGELIAQAHALGYAAIAITDECSMAGVVRALEATQDYPIQLIIGAEFHTGDGLHLVLLAPTQRAYAQICGLITLGRRRSRKGAYQLARADFETGLDECLVLWVPRFANKFAPTTGSQDCKWAVAWQAPIVNIGPVVGMDLSANNRSANWLRRHFPRRAWIAVELHREAGDATHLAYLQTLGHATGLPLVAAGDVHMHIRERRALQDTLTAIRHHCTVAEAGHRLFPNGERHLRTLDDLARVYPRELLDQTLEIASRCAFSLRSLKYRYPHELVPPGKTAIQHLRELTEAGVRYRWPNGPTAKVRADLERELTLIAELGYEHFFLTVHDLVLYARANGILCQGRGSAANSIVCYALRITEVNPDEINLLFERFMSKERNEPPDIDVDFEHERREEVIQYIYQKYGRERAAIAATVISYRPRSALRDVGKALGLGLDVVDRLAKSQAYWDNWQAFRDSLSAQGLDLDAGVSRRLCALVQQLLGFPRHLSQHVGGFVIAEQPVSELVPMENAAMPKRTIIQWDKNDLETLGLLKVDVLALGMLTAMRKTFALLAKAGAGPTRMDQVPREDPETYAMIRRAETVGAFQIESRAQMSMLPRLKPEKFYDLVIEVAIVRPGPIQGGMVHPYLERRKNPALVSYPSPELKRVLEKTLGVPIFQEQVMRIAIEAAGFSPGRADQLRRSMAAWNRNGTIGRFRQELLDGMHKRGYTREFAEQIWKQIEGFGEYGFPESHSASFALLTYLSSYLKCHQPAAFIAGVINSQPMGFYQPAQLLEEAKRQKVTILPVDVTASEWNCTLEPDQDGRHAIRLGMRLVRSLREEEADRIVAARSAGRFETVEEVAQRAALPKRAVKALALAGAFRTLTSHRRLAFWSALGVEGLQKGTDLFFAAGAERCGELFAKNGSAPFLVSAAPFFVEPTPPLPAASEHEEILTDHHYLGFSTGRHLLELLRPRLRRLGVLTRKELEHVKNGRTVKVCGIVTHMQRPGTASGVVFASLEDETGINNIIIWPAVFAAQRQVLLRASLMLVKGTLQYEDNVTHVIATRVEDYSHWIKPLPRNSRDFH